MLYYITLLPYTQHFCLLLPKPILRKTLHYTFVHQTCITKTCHRKVISKNNIDYYVRCFNYVLVHF